MNTNWRQFFQDGDGAYSSNRIVYLAWSLVILFLLSYLTIQGKAFPKIESALIFMYATVVAGKVVQSFSENSVSSTK